MRTTNVEPNGWREDYDSPPTFYPTEEDEEEMRMLSEHDNLYTMVSKDMYATAHQFSQPSVSGRNQTNGEGQIESEDGQSE
ncbi:hypothetical protein niasHT_031761 [Heterodera trifolii]|uniref:Uncharacterized protein n=1 Tax=Heterodera trifolii TaxID=157864 RepID=A0ABD2IH02_9BILA